MKRWILTKLRDNGKEWFTVALILASMFALMSLAGCNNPHARPLRGTAESTETGHFMDDWWMDAEEAQIRSDNRTKPADSWYDYFTR